MRVLVALHPHQHLVFDGLANFRYSGGYVAAFHCGLIFISVVTIAVERFFICLLAIYIFFGEDSVKSIADEKH